MTPEEYVAQYEANIDYDLDVSIAKAKLFIVACRGILALRPSLMSTDGVQMSFASIKDQLHRAESWLQAKGGPTGQRSASRRWDMRGIRG